MASRPLVLGTEFPITLSPSIFLPPGLFLLFPMLYNTPSCTPTFCKDYHHMFQRVLPHHVWLQGLSRRYTAGLYGPGNLGTSPCSAFYLYIMVWRSNCPRISAFFLCTSPIQSFIILNCCESCIHTCSPGTSTVHCRPWIHPHGTLLFHIVLIFNRWPIIRFIRRAGLLTIKADGKQAWNWSKLQWMHLFKPQLWPDIGLNRKVKPGLRFLCDLWNTNHNIGLASIMRNQSFIMTIICAQFLRSGNTKKLIVQLLVQMCFKLEAN